MMGKKKEPKTMGRPRIEIKYDEFEKLCYFQATLQEIASWFDCCERTIETRVKEHYLDEDEKAMSFCDVSARLRGKGKISLRRKQFQRGMEGSDKMLIHLGKQYLGQSEKSEVEHTVKGPLVIMMGEEDESKEVNDDD